MDDENMESKIITESDNAVVVCNVEHLAVSPKHALDNVHQIQQKMKRKHRRGKPKPKNWKFQMPKYNNCGGGGGGGGGIGPNQRQRSKLIRSNSLAPYNTNRFLMEEHMVEVPLLSTAQRTRDSSFSVDSEDNYFYSLPEDEEDFLTKEFSNVYEKARVERLENLSKQELIQECLQMEDRFTTDQGTQSQVNIQRITAEFLTRIRALEQKIKELSRENYNLRCQVRSNALAAATASPPSAAAPTSAASQPIPMMESSSSEDTESDSSSSSSSSSSNSTSSSSSNRRQRNSSNSSSNSTNLRNSSNLNPRDNCIENDMAVDAVVLENQINDLSSQQAETNDSNLNAAALVVECDGNSINSNAGFLSPQSQSIKSPISTNNDSNVSAVVECDGNSINSNTGFLSPQSQSIKSPLSTNNDSNNVYESLDKN